MKPLLLKSLNELSELSLTVKFCFFYDLKLLTCGQKFVFSRISLAQALSVCTHFSFIHRNTKGFMIDLSSR